MNRILRIAVIVTAASAVHLMVSGAMAQEASKASAATRSGSIPEPVSFVTQHTGTFGGQRVRYSATAGETYLKDDDGGPTGSIFSVAYMADGTSDPAARPVTFFWNGGPGSSSVWLHMGAFGPKRVVLDDNATDDGAAPFDVVDNPLTFLDVTDLVFIDPVGTGYSRPLGDHEGKEFWGVGEDAASVAAFIRTWLTANKRWASPKYIGGESYGTTRSAAVIRELEAGYDDVSINGIILVSTVLDFYTSAFNTGNELGYITFLPTMAATAVYHGKADLAGRTLEVFVEEAREFAISEYAPALLRGNRLPLAERARIRAKLSSFIGISEDYLEKSDLRITERRYFKELLRDEGRTVGRLDGRFTGVDPDDVGENVEADPSFFAIDGAYGSALKHYLSADLGVEIERQYKIFGSVSRDWNWTTPGQRPGRLGVNVAPFIGTAMRQNSAMRVFNAAGYYDFATPFFDAEMSLTRNGVVPERITFKYYEAGHMMYIHQPSMDQLMADIRAFILTGSN